MSPRWATLLLLLGDGPLFVEPKMPAEALDLGTSSCFEKVPGDYMLPIEASVWSSKGPFVYPGTSSMLPLPPFVLPEFCA